MKSQLEKRMTQKFSQIYKAVRGGKSLDWVRTTYFEGMNSFGDHQFEGMYRKVLRKKKGIDIVTSEGRRYVRGIDLYEYQGENIPEGILKIVLDNMGFNMYYFPRVGKNEI